MKKKMPGMRIPSLHEVARINRSLRNERESHKMLREAVRDFLDVSPLEEDTSEIREMRNILWNEADSAEELRLSREER